MDAELLAVLCEIRDGVNRVEKSLAELARATSKIRGRSDRSVEKDRPRLLSIAEVAKRLNIGRESARQVALRHMVRFRVTDGSYRVPETAIDAYLARREEAPVPPLDLRSSNLSARPSAPPMNPDWRPSPGSRAILVHEPKPRGRRRL